MISHYILGKHTQYMIKGISIGYLKKIPQSILQAKVRIHGLYLFSTFNINHDIVRFTRLYLTVHSCIPRVILHSMFNIIMSYNDVLPCILLSIAKNGAEHVYIL